jgi:hypothetical protein
MIMKTAIAFFIALVTVAILTPFAIDENLAAYPTWLLLWIIPVLCFFAICVPLPIYALLLPRRQTRLVPLMLVGFLAAFFSWSLFRLLFLHLFLEHIGGSVYVTREWREWLTWVGSRNLFWQAVLMGVAGAMGGFVFWGARRLRALGGPVIPAPNRTLLASFGVVGASTAALSWIPGCGTVLYLVVGLTSASLVAGATSDYYADNHPVPVILVAFFLNVLVYGIPATLIWLVSRAKWGHVSGYVLLCWCAFYLASLFVLFPASECP